MPRIITRRSWSDCPTWESGTSPLPCSLPHSSRASFGLAENACLFWCGHSPPKYLPQHDDILPRIAAAANRECQFLFVAEGVPPSAVETFRDRIGRAFDAHGLSASRHCGIFPSLDLPRFLGAGIVRCPPRSDWLVQLHRHVRIPYSQFADLHVARPDISFKIAPMSALCRIRIG